MAISVNWATKVINIPQADLTSLEGGLYELDINQLRLDLRALEALEEGIVWSHTHNHNTATTLSGTTYAGLAEFVNGYTVDFEDGTYTVKCVNANHNLGDVKVLGDNVSLVIGNSAGLIQVTSGSGVLPSDIVDIADAVWDEALADHNNPGSAGKNISTIKLLSLDK